MMNEWRISEALKSVRRLTELVGELTDDELRRVIEIEEAAQRRDTIIERLYREARKRARNQFVRNGNST